MEHGVSDQVLRLVERGVIHKNRLWIFPDEPKPIIIGHKSK
jgi:hypothetical protein